MTGSQSATLQSEQSVESIAQLCEAGEMAAVDLLDAETMQADGAHRLVRVRIIPALRAAKDQQRLVRVLQLWLEAKEAKASDWLMLAATLRDLGEHEAAQMVLDRLVNQYPHDAAVMTAAMQHALQNGHSADAAHLADTFACWQEIPARAAQMGMSALLRDGKPERAVALGKACTETYNGPVNALMADAYMALDNLILANRHARRALAAGHDTANVRLLLANVASARLEHERAIKHLTAAVETSPDNVRALVSLGELMLIRRRPKAASIYLQRALKLAPGLVHLRVLLARAYKDQRNYAAAADEFKEVLRLKPDNLQHQRQAAAVYRLANRPEEATKLLHDAVSERRKTLPTNLQAGLVELWNRTDDAIVPPARLEWAWSLRSPDTNISRDEWERRARWGWLADRLLQEWLETSPDSAEEAMSCLADLGPSAKKLEAAARSDGDMILASAHIGPLFAGPLALQLLNLRCKWLASTPSIEGMPYSVDLISTTDQSESQVVRASMAALDSGISIGIAVDGAMTMAAPRVLFEEQEVTYSSFAARLAHRKSSRSFFVAPQWLDGQLTFDVTELPRASAKEPLEPFLARWREEWFVNLRRLLRGEPENLRLSGGIWRHVRPLMGTAA